MILFIIMESEFMEEDKHTIELPKLNEEELFKTRDLGIGTVVNNNSEVYVIKSKKSPRIGGFLYVTQIAVR